MSRREPALVAAILKYMFFFFVFIINVSRDTSDMSDGIANF